MYLEIDEGYFEHPKTLDLCARLSDSKACVYPLRLWKWACRSAKSGKLGKISSFAMEKAVDYEPMDGRCFESMCHAGFVDRNEDGTFEIHDWMSYTGGALKRMEDKAADNRRRREEGKKRFEAEQNRQRTGIVPVQSENRTGTNLTQTRQDKTSPDKTSPDPEESLSRDPGTPEPEGKKNAYSWRSFFASRWWQKRGRQYGQGEADARACGRLDEFLSSLPDEERAKDWEQRERMVSEFLNRADRPTVESGWSFSFFASGFQGLRIPESERPARPTNGNGQTLRKSNY